MDIEGNYSIRAPRDAVEAALADLDLLRRAIPGCESIELTGPGEAKAAVAVTIGDFGARFTGTVNVEGDGDAGWNVSGSGRGRPAGSAKGAAEVKLADSGSGTALTYRGTIEVGGKLGDVSADALASYGREMLDRFLADIESAAREKSGWVDELDHSMAGVQLGDEPSEDTVTDKSFVAGEVAEEVEERLELAAGRSYLGGPFVWGLIAVIALIIILAVASS